MNPADVAQSALPLPSADVSLIALFFVGGVVGAVGYKHAGFLFTLPLAALLLLLAAMPVIDDLRRFHQLAPR